MIADKNMSQNVINIWEVTKPKSVWSLGPHKYCVLMFDSKKDAEHKNVAYAGSKNPILNFCTCDL